MPRPLRRSEIRKILENDLEMLSAFVGDFDTISDLINQWTRGVQSVTFSDTRRGGRTSDPTPSQALSVDQWGNIRDLIVHHVRMVDRAATGLDLIRRNIRPSAAEVGIQTPRGWKPSICANRFCPDGGYAERSGRCIPCYTFWKSSGVDRRR